MPGISPNPFSNPYRQQVLLVRERRPRPGTIFGPKSFRTPESRALLCYMHLVCPRSKPLRMISQPGLLTYKWEEAGVPRCLSEDIISAWVCHIHPSSTPASNALNLRTEQDILKTGGSYFHSSSDKCTHMDYKKHLVTKGDGM